MPFVNDGNAFIHRSQEADVVISMTSNVVHLAGPQVLESLKAGVFCKFPYAAIGGSNVGKITPRAPDNGGQRFAKNAERTVDIGHAVIVRIVAHRKSFFADQQGRVSSRVPSNVVDGCIFSRYKFDVHVAIVSFFCRQQVGITVHAGDQDVFTAG